MDKSIPLAAQVLLSFIYQTETKTPSPGCYEVIFGHNQFRLARPITAMTIAQIQSVQASWSKRFGSSATGAAQFMRATLKGLVTELGLSGKEVFDGDMQDRLAFHLLVRRGYTLFMTGKITTAEFGKRLAQEWASFPVLVAGQGAHQKLKRGQSYYAGDALNKSLTKPETVEKVLGQMKRIGIVPKATVVVKEPVAPVVPVEPTVPVVPAYPEPAPRVDYDPMTPPHPEDKKSVVGVWAAVGAAIIITVGAFANWLTDLPCNLVGLFCGG